MKILIITSTFKEAELLPGRFNLLKEVNKNFNRYRYKDQQIDLLVTGIGSVMTVYALMKYITNNTYNLIVQLGIGGSYSKKFQIGNAVNIVTEQFADLGIEDKNSFFTLFEKKIISADQFPYSGGKLINPLNFERKMISDIPQAEGITVNRVTGRRDTISLYSNKFSPDIESMEGAAFFYVCLIENIPFLELRGISNFVEERNRDLWDINSAVKSSNESLLKILERINL